MTIYEVEAPAEVEVLTEAERRARTLEAAALEIEVRGWASTTKHPENVCILQGVACAMGLPRDYWSSNEVIDVWGPSGENEVKRRNRIAYDVFGFNDSRATSPSDAAFVLRWRAEEIRDGWESFESGQPAIGWDA